MQNLDTDISNYGLQDILNLFAIPVAFNETHLKHAKRIVLKTHPDKCNLPKEYFLFFTKAYRILHQIYTMRHEKAQGYAHADTYRDLDSDAGAGASAGSINQSKLLASMSPSEFNRWFNAAFERYRVPNDEDDAGYEDWFRNGEVEVDPAAGIGGPVPKTQWSASLESARSRMMALVPAASCEPVSYDCGGGGSGGIRYEDLKRAHTETLIPITETDIQTHTGARCRNVQELRNQRTASASSAEFAPLRNADAMRVLDKEKERDAEQCTHRAYLMAKQDEIARDMNKKFMKEFRLLNNG